MSKDRLMTILTVVGLVIAALACFPTYYALVPESERCRPFGRKVCFESAPSVTPTITLTPVTPQIPEMKCLPQACFASIWKNYAQLGCPIQCAKSNSGYQDFEKGMMIWREDVQMIYAVFKNVGRWEKRPAQGWNTCLEVDPDFGPHLGFGEIWCEYWKAQLGKPIAREKNIPSGLFEDFRDGLVIDLGVPGSFIFFADGTYRPF